MKIAELIDRIEIEMSPYLDIQDIDIRYSKRVNKTFSLEEKKPELNISIIIFFDADNNFITTFYGHNPPPKTIEEILSKIKKEMKDRKITFKVPVNKKNFEGFNAISAL